MVAGSYGALCRGVSPGRWAVFVWKRAVCIMIARYEKTGSIGRFFGGRELVATVVCCYVVPEGDSHVPYSIRLVGHLKV